MATLLEYKDNLAKYNACARYMRPMQKAMEHGDSQSLIELATDINGADVTCDSFAFGWGLDEERYLRDFKEYINGDTLISHNGYFSKLYVGSECTIDTVCALIILLGCNCSVKVKKGFKTIIYTANSKLTVLGEGEVEVYAYGECELEFDSKLKSVEKTCFRKSKWMKDEEGLEG